MINFNTHAHVNIRTKVGLIHNRIPQKHGKKTMSGVRTSQSDASSDMDFPRAPRRTARKKGSGYENGLEQIPHPGNPGANLQKANARPWEQLQLRMPDKRRGGGTMELIET
jgi:hypothetical protein